MVKIDLVSKLYDVVKAVLWLIFCLIPKNLLSFLVGFLARLRLPEPFNQMLGKAFVSLFGIDIKEATKPLSHYKSIEDIFTRELKPGLRPIESEFCSPCDGTLSQGGAAHGQFAVQVKGLHYFLPELVAQESAQDLSWFSTIYLAPHNYHRVHSPISGRLKTITHVSGELWPVNAPFVQIVPQLFVKNERLIFEIEMNPGELCYLVMVGALNVGRIESPFWSDLTTNELHNMHWFSSQTKSKDCNEEIKIGDELGTFMLGSTVVLVLNQAAEATFDSLSVKVGNIKLGQSLLS